MNRLAAVMLFVALASSACGKDAPARSSADQLHAAISRTLAVDSIHISATYSREAGQGHATAEIDYNAPDRLHTRLPDGSASLRVGRDVYVSDFDDKDQFLHSSTRALSRSEAFPFLDAAREAGNVKRDGAEFVVKLSDGDATIRVLLAGGYVSRVRVDLRDAHQVLTTTYRYSQVNVAPTVTAPSSAKVSESPTMPACSDPAAADAIVCDSSG